MLWIPSKVIYATYKLMKFNFRFGLLSLWQGDNLHPAAGWSQGSSGWKTVCQGQSYIVLYKGYLYIKNRKK